MEDPFPISDPKASADEEDKRLMLAIAQGNDAAMEALIKKYQRLVYGTLVKMLGDVSEAEDLAQQVFVRIYRAAPRYRATAQFRTWMFTILRHLVFNEHRRRTRARWVPLPSPADETLNSTVPELADLQTKAPDSYLLQDEQMLAVDAAIAALPEQQRLAVILRRYDEFSYEEIAAILQTSVSSTKSILFRARGTLRAALAAYLADEVACKKAKL